MSTATVEQHLTEIWETPKTLWGQLSSVDHKEIGKRYLVTALSCHRLRRLLLINPLFLVILGCRHAQSTLYGSGPAANRIANLSWLMVILWRLR